MIVAAVADGESVIVIAVDVVVDADSAGEDVVRVDGADPEAYDTAAAVVDWASDGVGCAAGWASLDSGVVVGVGGA